MACSIRSSPALVSPGVSASTTLPFSTLLNGRRIYEFWKLIQSVVCPTCRFRIHSSNASSVRASRVSRSSVLLEFCGSLSQTRFIQDLLQRHPSPPRHPRRYPGSRSSRRKVSGGKSPRLRLGITLQRSLPNAYGSLNLQFATHTFCTNMFIEHANLLCRYSIMSSVESNRLNKSANAIILSFHLLFSKYGQISIFGMTKNDPDSLLLHPDPVRREPTGHWPY